MADAKISGLPASTTPLAGTEVLPIVQSGVTKQVSVANLTAGRDIIANTLTVGLGGGSIAINTAVGYQAGFSNTIGAYNSFLGYQAGYKNTTGSNATFLGLQAGYWNTTGGDNIGIGVQAYAGNSGSGATGNYNLAIGDYSLTNNLTGAANVAIGNSTLANNISGASNTAIGYQSLNNNTSNNNTAIGYQSGYSNTTGGLNVNIGYQAGYSNNQSGGNTNVGAGSGYATINTINAFNSFVGFNAGYNNTSGAFNTSLGALALFSNTTASNNTAVGYQAGQNNLVGSACTFIGTYAGQASLGTGNQFFGYGAGYLVTTGANNTILGAYTGNQGGLDIRTANSYIVLSDGAGNPRLFSDGLGNIAIGGTTTGLNNYNNISFNNANDGWASVNHISGSGSGLAYFYFGYAGGVIGSISQSGTTAVLYNVTSDQRLKTNIVDAPAGNIDSIKVRSFDWITDNTHQTYGMVAQELLEVAPYAVHQPVDKEEMMAVDYSKLVPMMIKEIQDLKAKVASLGAK